MRPPTAVSLLLLTACPGPEQGLDKTVIRGVLEIPPWTGTEGEDSDKVEDGEWVNATALEPLTWRQMDVTGHSRYFGGPGRMGDPDRYTLAAQGDGNLEVTLTFTTTWSTENDATTYTVELYDLAVVDEEGKVPAVASVPSNGTHGVVTVAIPVVRGGTYGIGILAGRSTEFESGDYTFTVTSLTPADGQFMVGAYLEPDPTAHTVPVGGAAVQRLAWDGETSSWRGTFEILFVREVVHDTAEEEEQRERRREEDDTSTTLPPVWSTREDLETVYLAGGSFTGLNASIAAGTLFSATSVAVDTSAHGEDGIVGGWLVGQGPTGPRVASPVAVVVDTVRPRVIGWEFTETEPNDLVVTLEAYSPLDPATLAKAGNALPAASGPGFVDIVHGVQSYPIDDPAWGDGDVDVYRITVPEPMGLSASTGWTSADDDLDVLFYGPDGALWAYAAGVANPEVFSTQTDFGFALDPETAYYLVVLGYAGPAGDRDYTIDFEYAAP